MDTKICEVCGAPLTGRQTRYCSNECWLGTKGRRLRQKRWLDKNPEYNRSYYLAKSKKLNAKARHRAILKVANGKPIRCVICGCPHEEVLNFGHINHNGADHRRKIGSKRLVYWILNTSLEDVLSQIQLECVYCNDYERITGDYPTKDKQPKWSV